MDINKVSIKTTKVLKFLTDEDKELRIDEKIAILKSAASILEHIMQLEYAIMSGQKILQANLDKVSGK